jgi:hypothetical protein
MLVPFLRPIDERTSPTMGLRAFVVAALGFSAVLAFGARAGAADAGIDIAKSPVEWTRWQFRDPRGGTGSAKWERVKDRKTIRAAVAAARTIPRTEIDDCGLHVLERKTPDFDGDGIGDALYRLEWQYSGVFPSATKCPAPDVTVNATLIILSRSRRLPALELWSASEGDVGAEADLGKLRDGRPVIIVQEDMSESDTDCSVTTTRVIDPAPDSAQRELSRTSERSGCPGVRGE